MTGVQTCALPIWHHNLEANIKSGFVLCGGGAQALGFEELVRKFFTRRVKIGVVQRDRISGLETILMDYRYASSIGLLLHQEDLPKVDFVMLKGRNGVMGKIDRKSTRLNSSHALISYAVFCLKKKIQIFKK